MGRVRSFRDISARQRANPKGRLRSRRCEESKERYENFISQISDGVYRFELDVPMPLTLPVEEQVDYLYRHMFIAECNPSLMDMYGIKEPGDILGKTQTDFHGGSDNPLNRQAMRDFIQSGYRTRNVVTEEVDVHGNKKYFSNNSIGIIKNNHLVRMWGTQADISERRRAEAALRESEERFRTLYENSPLGLYRTTPDGKINLANPALIKMLGYSSFAELARINLEQSGFSPSHSRARFINEIEKNGEIKGMEYAWKRKDGTSVLVRESARAIRDAQGKTLYFDGIVEDISELKRTEAQKVAALKALRESEARYRALIETASDLVYKTDKAGQFTFMNQAALITTGYEEKELIGKEYVTLIRPDMRAKALKLFGRQFVKGIQNTYTELPIITKDGRELWIGQNIQMIRKDGRVTGFQAVSRDITEIKRMESHTEAALAALQRSEAKFRSMVETIPLAIYLSVGVDQISEYINPRMIELFGYTIDDIPSVEQWWPLAYPDESYRRQVSEEWTTKVKRAIATQSPIEPMEVLVTCKDGSKKNISWGYITMGDKNYAYGLDLTERKRAEAEIKRQLAEKENLLKEVHHRIKNNIASIGGLISLQLQSIANPEAIAVLKDAGSRVESMRLLYDKLLLTEGYEDLSVKNYLDDLIATIIAIFPDKEKVTIKKRIADFDLDSRRLFPLGIIINELLTNKMKYAFSNKDAGIIKISLSKAGNHVALSIQDDGSRLPAGFDIDKTKGLGLTLVKMLSQQLGGSFSMEKGAGTRCKVEFDI